MINADLTPKAVVDILAADDPKVNPEGMVNLELEVGVRSSTFLTFACDGFAGY